MWTIICIIFWCIIPFVIIRSARKGRIKQVNDQFVADIKARVERVDQRFENATPERKIQCLERQKAMAGVAAFFSGLIGFFISPGIGIGRTVYSAREAERMREEIDAEINQIRGEKTHA